MKKTWTSGLEPQLAADVESAFKASTVLRRRLEQLCNNKIDSSYKLGRSEYDCPNWHLLQADSVGYRRAMEEIISLITERE